MAIPFAGSISYFIGTKETDTQRKAREHQLQEGRDVFGHFLSNIDSQKKAIAKKKALEKVYISIILLI